MNGDVTVKTKDGVIVRIPYATITKVKFPSKSEETTTKVASSEQRPEDKKKSDYQKRPVRR